MAKVEKAEELPPNYLSGDAYDLSDNFCGKATSNMRILLDVEKQWGSAFSRSLSEIATEHFTDEALQGYLNHKQTGGLGPFIESIVESIQRTMHIEEPLLMDSLSWSQPAAACDECRGSPTAPVHACDECGVGGDVDDEEMSDEVKTPATVGDMEGTPQPPNFNLRSFMRAKSHHLAAYGDQIYRAIATPRTTPPYDQPSTNEVKLIDT